MVFRSHSTALVALILTTSLAFAQDAPKEKKVPPHPTRKTAGPAVGVTAAPEQFAQRSKFAANVLQSAVALPQNDTQDRLRVLVSAARLANSLGNVQLKKSLAREGIDLESRLISSGQQPPVSMVETGIVDCNAVSGLAEAVRPEALASADRTISAAVSACPKQTLETVERKLSDAIQHGGVPPLALLSAMQAAGPKSNWTMQTFDAAFSSLPDPKDSSSVKEAPMYANVYERFAAKVDAASARSAGSKLLAWIGKMDTSPERIQAATTATTSIKQVLGEKGLQDVREADPIADQAAQLAGQPLQMPAPDEEKQVQVGSLDTKEDHAGDLENEPAPRRAREAAAYGYAAGSAGDQQMAARYFDVAFNALNDVWSDRLPGLNVAGLVDEVSQAAASVDPVEALKRAQRLQNSSTQALSMIAIANTVLNRQAAGSRPKLAQK